MKLKAFKAKPKRGASPTRGKGTQELSGLGTGNLKGPDAEFRSTLSTQQTSDASTIDPAKDYDIRVRTDPSLDYEAHTDPSSYKMGAVMSTIGTSLPPDALIVNLAGASEAGSSVSAV